MQGDSSMNEKFQKGLQSSSSRITLEKENQDIKINNDSKGKKRVMKLLLIAVLLILFIVIVVIAYILGKGKKNEEESIIETTTTTTTITEEKEDESGESEEQNESQQVTTISEDPYAGWKTYTNNEWGISFKHNGSGAEREIIDNPGVSDPNVIRVGFEINNDYGNEIVIRWDVWENPEKLSLNEFYETYQSYKTGCSVDKNFKIGDKTVIRALCPNEPMGVPLTEVYIFDSQQRVFLISYLHYMDEKLMEYTDLSIQTIKVQ
ncbi:hypothetical protein JW766_02365 [Candidatus Dojkabacteria bacterium]|nr:hypothetical protein [Candidatus Dojkabacteria bacterium]